jgi:hypothetical protein
VGRHDFQDALDYLKPDGYYGFEGEFIDSHQYVKAVHHHSSARPVRYDLSVVLLKTQPIAAPGSNFDWFQARPGLPGRNFVIGRDWDRLTQKA